MTLRLTDIRHAYGPKQVLRGVTLEVAPGEILCLLGPSGDGKTTLLRLVAGLEALQHGDIALDNRTLGSLPPEARNAGFVPQHHAPSAAHAPPRLGPRPAGTARHPPATALPDQASA